MDRDWDVLSERTKRAFLAGLTTGEDALGPLRKERLDELHKHAGNGGDDPGQHREAESGGSRETDGGQSIHAGSVEPV
jgi:hypothetical protein